MKPSLEAIFHAFQSGKIGDAETLARAFLDEVPGHPVAIHFQGLCSGRRGDVASAIALVEEAVLIAPDYVEARNNLGLLYIQAGREADAERAFREAIAEAPQFAPAHNQLGMLLARSGRNEEAIQLLEKAVSLDTASFRYRKNLGDALWVFGRETDAAEHHDAAITHWRGKPDDAFFEHLFRRYTSLSDQPRLRFLVEKWVACDPENPLATHYHAALTGKGVPPRASDAHVAQLFDGFASTFDEQLERAGYAGPDLCNAAVRNALSQPVDVMLDAGCGTGLCGIRLRSFCQRLIGVDLSLVMLEHARARGSYDELVHSEITAYLDAHPQSVDLIVCADTLIYFGDIGPLIMGFHKALKKGGHVAFTIERNILPGTTYRLEPHGRYSQSPEYVRAVLRDASFEIVRWEDVVLRTEASTKVLGDVIVAKTKV